MKSKKDSY